MRILLLSFLFIIANGCVSTPDGTTSGPENNNDLADVGRGADVLNDAEEMDVDVPDVVDSVCEPTTTVCAATMCGSIDDGCGNELDCGQCECESGRPQITNCGPCNMGSIACEPNATGEGTSVGSVVPHQTTTRTKREATADVAETGKTAVTVEREPAVTRSARLTSIVSR